MKKMLFIAIALVFHVTVTLAAHLNLMPRLQQGWQNGLETGTTAFAVAASGGQHPVRAGKGLKPGAPGSGLEYTQTALSTENFEPAFILPTVDGDVESILVSATNSVFAYPYPALGSKPGSGMEPLPGGIPASFMAGNASPDAGLFRPLAHDGGKPSTSLPSAYGPTAPRKGDRFPHSGWERIDPAQTGHNVRGDGSAGSGAAATPEPGTLLLLCTGGLALSGFLRARMNGRTCRLAGY